MGSELNIKALDSITSKTETTTSIVAHIDYQLSVQMDY
jgi:hypothetical protein